MINPHRRLHAALLLTVTAELLGCAQANDQYGEERSDARGPHARIARPGADLGAESAPGAAVNAPLVSAAWTLTVAKVGTGSGTITSTPSGPSCDLACDGGAWTFADGETVTLVAAPQDAQYFAGWSGACSGSGDCVVTLNADAKVTAAFAAERLEQGADCVASVDCESGECVDGVCCDSPCGGGVDDCQACNVAGSGGVCVPIAAGVECRAAAGACDLGEQCDGVSSVCPADALADNTVACRVAAGECDVAEVCSGSSPDCPENMMAVEGVACGEGVCANGAWNPAGICDGVTSSCVLPTPTSCGVYACGGSACLVSCTTGADCASGFLCEAGACVPTLSDGSPCTSNSDCGSGSCVDGVCCDSSCAGQCEACDVPGRVGECAAVLGAPRGARPSCPGAGSICGGACNGAVRDECKFPDDTVVCLDAACQDGVATLESRCDGGGACAASQQPCAPFECGVDACLGDCTVDADCATGSFCHGGICASLGVLGAACQADHECLDGSCADGVCCDAACDGQCEACDIAGSIGTCSPALGAPRGARPQCSGDDSVCAGTCDGLLRESCAYPSSATVCSAGSCADGVASTASTCDGAGACGPSVPVDCAPFACGAEACAGDCQSDGDCASGDHCAAGVCSPPAPDGAACSQAGDCQGGLCVDGYCCNTTCAGQCEACDVPGSEGVCTPALGAPRGPRTACAGGDSTCSGACDGVTTESCVYPTIACRPASCGQGVATLAAMCDGHGSCPPEEHQDCGPFACGDGACDVGCEGDQDCDASSYCAAGVCHERLLLGLQCGVGSECESGACVDGVCCDTTCDGQCSACDAPGSVGVCSPVLGAPHGGRASCDGSGACAGTCDGTTMSACVFPGASAKCGDPSACTDGVATPPSVCDGAGECIAALPQDCGALGCDGDRCATPCADDSACVEGRCVAGKCVSEPAPSGVGGGNPTDGAGLAGGCSTSVPAAPFPASGVIAIATLATLLLRRRVVRSRADAEAGRVW